MKTYPFLAPLDPGYAQQLLTHPLPHWVERMTVSYLKSKNGTAEKEGRFWKLIWPDGALLDKVAFNSKDAEEHPSAYHLTMEDPRIRGLAMTLPRFVAGQPVPVVRLKTVSDDIKGFWSLWKVSLYTDDWNRSRILPIFMTGSDKIFLPTAKHIWDQLLSEDPVICGYLDAEKSTAAYARLFNAAEKYGEPVYNDLLHMHQVRITREREKSEYAFAARRKAIERIGLQQVKTFRHARLDEEERHFRARLKRLELVHPEMTALLLIMIPGTTNE